MFAQINIDSSTNTITSMNGVPEGTTLKAGDRVNFVTIFQQMQGQGFACKHIIVTGYTLETNEKAYSTDATTGRVELNQTMIFEQNPS